MDNEIELDISTIKQIEDTPILTDYGRRVNGLEPNVLKIPIKIQDLDDISTFKEKDIIEYFTHLIKGWFKIHNINGEEESMFCCHCSRSIERGKDLFHYYCYGCHDLKCAECVTDTKKVLSVDNETENILKTCENHKFTRRNTNIKVTEYRVCDNCDEICENDKDYYTNGNYDACSKCVTSGKIDVDEMNLKKVEKQYELSQEELEYMDHFGSILNWVPLYYDENLHESILYCANPESSLYKKCALSCLDSLGRKVIYTCQDEDNLENLAKEYAIEKQICDYILKSAFSKIDDDDDVDDAVKENTPIGKMMLKRNMCQSKRSEVMDWLTASNVETQIISQSWI